MRSGLDLCYMRAELVPLIEQHCNKDSHPLFGKGTSNMFASLARNICGQQLATKAAYSIHLKFITTCKVHWLPVFRTATWQLSNYFTMRGLHLKLYVQRSLVDPVQPADILKLQFEDLRACGLSGAKVKVEH